VASFDKAIPPGQEGKVTLKVNTSKRKGVFSKSAAVISNDPKTPKTNITLRCNVKQYMSITPHNRINILGFEGDKITKEVTITSFEEHPFEITDITSTLDDKIKYKLKTGKKGREYTLKVNNRSTQAGSFNGNIVVKTDSKKKPHIVLKVNGKLRKEVAVRPATLTFGTVDTAKDNADAKGAARKIQLKDARKKGFTIKKVKPSSSWIKADIEIKKENKHYIINVTLDRNELPKGKFEETIEIYTSYKKKPMVVKVKGNAV
jgi:hypothetical protein